MTALGTAGTAGMAGTASPLRQRGSGLAGSVLWDSSGTHAAEGRHGSLEHPPG